MYEIPIKPIILELTELLNGPKPKEETLPKYNVALAAFRIDEQGYPIEGTFKVSLIFDELQRIKSDSNGLKISEILKNWYRSLFPIDISWGSESGENRPLFPISRATKPLTFKDFENIKTALDDTYFKNRLGTSYSKALFHQKYEYREKYLTEANIQEMACDYGYYVKDIALTANRIEKKGCGDALKLFLKATPSSNRVDWLEKPEEMVKACNPKYLPSGRWPSKLNQNLCLAQQAAVNTSLRELKGKEGIIAINGPPGTGKTTLLRDIIADIIVQRACRLSRLEKATDLFTHKETRSGTTMYFLEEDFASCQEAILIVSSNNQVVENISLELPLEKQIDESFLKEFSYFPDIADKFQKEINKRERCWGMISAPLGKSSNRWNFLKGFLV